MKLLILLITTALLVNKSGSSIIREYVLLDRSTYEYQGETHASITPRMKSEGDLSPFNMRFDYLLIKKGHFYKAPHFENTKKVLALYPDTAAMDQAFMNLLTEDTLLNHYFQTTYAGIFNNAEIKKSTFKEAEVMEVAARFFYCHDVNPDTSIQWHICLGINEVEKGDWHEDRTLAEAFAIEALFDDLLENNSPVMNDFDQNINKAQSKFEADLIDSDLYISKVQNQIYRDMEKSKALKKGLRKYYKSI